jgi:2-keto-4-pentenoate hydratase/2-oxohepta-3-ene-1,7-dioic acid hydratase in catechol pathway
MRRAALTVLAASAVTVLSAQAPATTGFKLGTFERKDTPFVGVVLRDTVVIDLAAADAAVMPAPSVAAPRDMKDLIARYDKGVRSRILELIGRVNAAGAVRPSWVVDLSSLKTLPPIMYPQTMLNMAVNYREHALEMGGAATSPTGPGAALPGTRSAPGIWERQAADTRWNPYLFTKLPSAVIAAGESIQLPAGRGQIDWECELGVVIGARASRVAADRAHDHIFGYTIENDVSDRGGRGDTRHGGDWLIAKSHDTFAPLGPFIVPKEFVPDPQKLKVTFKLNGQVMQAANTSLMIHTVFEQVSYASHILTLRPGDVIATGSPAGVGSARTPPIFLKAGDISECTYEGVGTLRNPVAGAS